MGVYLTILFVLYILALSGVVNYACSRPWAKKWLTFNPKDVDICFSVQDSKSEQAVFTLINYLNDNGGHFYKRELFKKSRTVATKDIVSLLARNSIESFRIVSTSKSNLTITAECPGQIIKYGCTCSEGVFNSLLRVTRKVRS